MSGRTNEYTLDSFVHLFQIISASTYFIENHTQKFGRMKTTKEQSKTSDI